MEEADSRAAAPLHAALSADWSADSPVALLLFHGYGADEWDLAPLAPILAPLPWAALRAPIRPASGGNAWFTLAPGDDRGPASATDAVWRWVDLHLHPARRVLAVGFSQGGFMATQLLRTRPDRVVATVVLSGFVHVAPQQADERLAVERPPVFWGRGTRDRLITADAVERTGLWLAGHATTTERVYRGLAHGIGDQEISDVRAFVRAQLTLR